jgi:hypothetical protein
MNRIIEPWQQTTPKGIKIGNGTELKNIPYADDLVLSETLEHDVQRSVTTSNRILQLYSMKISKEKTKSIGLQGKWWSGVKVVINDKTIEQISSLNYLGCKIRKSEIKIWNRIM